MRQTKKHLRQIFAVLLSVVLVFSSFEGISLTGYAAENTGVGDTDTETDIQQEEENDGSVPAKSLSGKEEQASEEKAVETETGAEEEPTSVEESTQEESSLIQEESSLTQEDGRLEDSSSKESTLDESTLEEDTSEELTTETEKETEELLTTEELRINDEGAQSGEAYTGEVVTYENGWRELIICESAFEAFYNNADASDADAQKSFDDAVIMEILTGHAEDTDKFDSVKIEYKVIADHETISQSLWNAVAEFGGRNETFYANFHYVEEEALELRWSFENPETTDTDVNIKVTKLEIHSDTGDGVAISFANTDFPAGKVGLSTYTDTSRTNGGKYQALAAAFGDTYIKLAAYKGTEEIDGIQGEYWTSAGDEGVNAAGFVFEDVRDLQPGTEYTLKKNIYKGDIWTDDESGRTGLDITYQDAGKDDALTIDEIREIIETYYADETFDEIYIEQPAGDSGVVSKEMADMLCPYLKIDTHDCRLRFGFVGANGVCTEWKLWNPKKNQDKDQTVSAVMTATDSKISMTIEKKPAFRSEKTELCFSVNREQDSTTADNIMKILGADEGGIVFMGNDDSEAGGWYSSDEWNVRIDTDAVNEMTQGVPYTVEKYAYKGDTWDWTDDDGTEHIGLNINYGGAGVEELTPDTVREILSRREGETFDEIHLEQPYKSDGNVISKEVADELYNYLKMPADGAQCSVRFGFVNEDDGSGIEWQLVNPAAEQVGDRTVSAKLNISADNIVTIMADAPSFQAEDVGLNFIRNNQRDNETVAKLKEIFGETDCELFFFCENQEDAYGNFIVETNDEEPENYNVIINVYSVNALAVGETYTAEKKVYKGEVFEAEGRSELSISYRGAGKEDALTAEEIKDILAHHAGETFDEIYIEQPSEDRSNVILKEVADEAYKYLKEQSAEAECRVKFGFIDAETEACIEWRLVNPKAQQKESQTASAALTVTEEAVTVVVTEKPEFAAERTEIGFTRNAERDGETVNHMKNLLGEEQGSIIFVDDTGKETDGYYGYDDDNLWLGINSIEKLETGKTYTAAKSEYKGDSYTWTDEADETKVYSGLNISYRSAGKEEALTAEEIQQILSHRSGEWFDEIYLEQPYKSDSNVIMKAAADMMYQYLKPKADNEERRLFFVFVNAETDSRIEWGLINPQAEQEADQTADATMDISGDKVSLTISKPVLKAERVTFGVGKEMTKDPDSAVLMRLFGESGCDLVFQADEEQVVYGHSSADRNINIFWIVPYDVGTIQDGKVYSVEKDRYLGDVTENDILISSSNRLYDQDRFTSAQLEEIVTYYRSQGRSFHSVTIQQRRVDGIPNIIDKDLYNIARRILDDTPDRRLSFSFCGCQNTDKNRLPLNWEKQEWDNRNKHMEYAEFDYYYLQDDFIWSFVNPTETVQDIDANVTLKTEKNKGITIQLADNRPYSADDVSFNYYCDPQAVTGIMLEAALGKPEDFGGGKSTDLFVLNKETNTPDDRVAACYMTNEEWGDGYGNPPYNQNYSLYLNNVREWLPDREFWVTKMEYLPETAEKEFQLPALPEGAQNPVWQSYNTDIAVIEGDKLKQVDGNEGYVHFSVTYSLDGEEYQKAYRVYMVESAIPITRIQFDRKSLTMEAPPKGADWEALEYLEVKYYPANATIDMDQSNLKWTTSDNKVVTLNRNSSGKCEGEIKAVGAGKATIRAEYKEGIYAECEVTVEEPIVIEDGNWPEPYAVTNFDTKLADVAFPKDDNGEWKWKEPDTNLAPYADMGWHLFAAVYTRNSDKKTMDAMVGVRMVSISGAEIVSASEDADIPAALTKDKRALLDVYLHVDNGDYADDIAQNKKYNDKVDIRWSSNPAGLLSAASEADSRNAQWFTANTPAGKKKITVSVVDKQTNKVLAKDSITINVTNNPVMDFWDMKVTVDGVLQENNEWLGLDKDAKAAGVIAFATDNPENKAYTLTAKSSDTSVLQVKPSGSNQIAYTVKNYGKVQLTVTANDEIKSSWNIEVSVPDKAPQIVQSQVTINKAGADKSALLTVVYADGYSADGADAVTVDGNDFAFANGRLVLQNTGLKGTASVKVRIKCISDDGRDSFTAEKTIKVKLVDKLPKVTLKQTKKVNAFYKNTADSHAGILTVNAGSATVSNVRTDSSSDFEIVSTGGKNVYRITLKDNKQNTYQPKVKVLYTITDSTGTRFDMEKELKAAVENKVPVLVLSAKADTLYPRAGFDDSVLTLSDKVTGRPIELLSVKYNNREITNPVSLNKNSYDIELEEDARIRFTLHNGQNNNYTKGTDKITLNVECAEWTKPANVSYSMKVNVNEPKLKLSSAKLTLNKNEATGIYQSTELTLALAGRTTPFDGYVTFDGTKGILNHVIAFNDRGEGRIGVRLNVSKEELKTLSEGSYSFTLTAHKDGWANGASTAIKVDVKDYSAEKCIKVSKKGSIDVLRRSQTYIAYTPKISNLAGCVIDGWITGTDAYLFDSEYDTETGQLRVRAKQNGMETWNYSTKGSYKITPVFLMETADGHQYEVMAVQQIVKVTQGKPKVTVLSEYGNTLYREAGNGRLTFGIAAELSDENIAIQDVTLVNYRKDLNVTYDEETEMVTLSQITMKEITKSAKTWSVKLAVRYADKAGNEKDAIMTYKIIIK